MNREELIRKMIRATGQRAFREISACALIVVFFGCRLPHLPVASTRYDGCLLLLASAVFIALVTWRFTLSDKLLHRHPASDTIFWHRIFLAQARLLRLVPLWYLAPLAAGIFLFSLPASPAQHAARLFSNVIWVALSFSLLSWLNRRAAVQIENEARAFAA